MDSLGLENIERSVLATIFFDPSKFEDVALVLDKTDFSLPFYQLVFECMQNQVNFDRPIQEDLLYPILKKDRLFDEEEFLNILALNPLINLDVYVEEVKNASIKRKLHILATAIAQNSQDESKRSEDILEEIEQKVFAISTQGAGEFKNSEEIVSDTIKFLESIKKRGNNILTGLNTGFEQLNRLTTGFNAGELIIIGARPSMGKTTFVLNIVQKILSTGKGVAFFSLEMPAEHLMLRMLSSSTSIPLQKLRVADMNEEQWADLSESANHIASLPFFVDDNSHININQLKSKIRKLKSKYPEVEAVVIDYLQLMAGSKKGGGEGKRHEEVSEISRGLKVLAREMQIPIIALSQLNRSLESREDKRPQLSDLRESGSIEQDADVILFLYRDDVYAKREAREKAKKEGKEFVYEDKLIEKAEIILAKNRNGETKNIKIQFNKQFIRFEEISQESETSYQPTKFDSGTSVDMSGIDMPANLG